MDVPGDVPGLRHGRPGEIAQAAASAGCGDLYRGPVQKMQEAAAEASANGAAAGVAGVDGIRDANAVGVRAPEIREVFKITKLDKLFEIESDEAAAPRRL